MNKKGFTMVELLAVITILGVIMAIAIPAVTSQITRTASKYYDDLEEEVKLAAMDFMNDHRSHLPKANGNSCYITQDNDLVGNEYIKAISDKKGNSCSQYVIKVTRNNPNDYSYEAYVECSDYTSDNFPSGDLNSCFTTDEVEIEGPEGDIEIDLAIEATKQVNVVNERVVYEIEDSTIASVSGTGLVRGKKPGATKLKMTELNGGNVKEINVIVRKTITIAYETSAGITSIGKTTDTCVITSGDTCQITLPSVVVNEPTYLFEGYYNGSSKLGNPGEIIELNNNMKVTAKTKANQFTVTYNYSENGGTSATLTSEQVTVGELVNLNATATKNGWTFVGWNTDKNATSGLTSLKMSESDITLYAIYKKEKVTYTANYSKGIGITSIGTTSNTCTIGEVYNNATQGASCSVTLPSITANSNSSVVGWYNGTTRVGGAGNSYTISSNVSLTAQGITTPDITQTSVNQASGYSWAKSRTFTITYTANNTIGTKYYYKIDSGSWIQISSTSQSVTFTNNGVLYAKVVDSLGNSKETSYTVTKVDSVAPSVEVVVDGIDATFTITDDIGAIGYGVNTSTTSQPSYTTYTATTSTTKTYSNNAGSYVVWVVDQAGNTNYKQFLLENLSLSASVKLGDYIKMTSTSTSFTTDASKTGYTSTQTINPSELNVWRVIKINDDGTIEIVSENVSSIAVYFFGQTGYKNFVGYLNEIANKYQNTNYTISARHMGYNGQTEYLTGYTTSIKAAPWTAGTTDNSNEAQGGGDILYTRDTDLVSNALGTLAANDPSGAATGYWLASREYSYVSSVTWMYCCRYVYPGGKMNSYNVYYYSKRFVHDSYSRSIRPILTLKSGLQATGSGTSEDPYVLP